MFEGRPGLAGWLCLAALACAPPAASRQGAPLRRPCGQGERWDGAGCQPVARGGRALLDQGAAALAAFQVEEALAKLEQARRSGPLDFADHVRLQEQLGIAYAYLEREAEALDAFAQLLALDPAHLLSYALSPKATFLFERARTQARARPATAVDLSWPYELEVTDPVPIEIEVVGDPRGLLSAASLHVRRRGERGERVADVSLAGVGGHRRLVLPPLATDGPEVLELWLVAHDRAGNESLLWASPDRPRAVALAYREPIPWYRKWWVWAVAGGAVAAGVAGTVYAITEEPPADVPGQFTWK